MNGLILKHGEAYFSLRNISHHIVDAPSVMDPCSPLVIGSVKGAMCKNWPPVKLIQTSSNKQFVWKMNCLFPANCSELVRSVDRAACGCNSWLCVDWKVGTSVCWCCLPSTLQRCSCLAGFHANTIDILATQYTGIFIFKTAFLSHSVDNCGEFLDLLGGKMFYFVIA